MDHNHSEHTPSHGWRYGVGAAVGIGIIAVLIYTGHGAHLLGALPYLFLLACPLLHIFMHGGHGGHNHNKSDKE